MLMKLEDGKMHNMILMAGGEGIEEWYCPTCGRRLLVTWMPQIEKTILDAGDPNAAHSGTLDHMPDHPTTLEDPTTIIDSVWLIPWTNWLEEVGFESLWDRDM